MDRRGFLTTILAAGAAPAVVKAESLMRIWVPSKPGLTVADIDRLVEKMGHCPSSIQAALRYQSVYNHIRTNQIELLSRI